MANDYGRHALSQRAAFEVTHPAVLAAAEQLANEPVLCVADLGAADGVNSHGLIRELVAQRDGRPLIYALVDLPTNPWQVAAAHLREAFGTAEAQGAVVVIPAPDESGPGVENAGAGAHYCSPEAHGDACRRALDRDPPPATVVSMAGIPLQQEPSLPRGSVHLAVTGTTMHWVAEAAGLASSGSVFPGYPTTWTTTSETVGASQRSGSGSTCSRCARPSWRRAGGSSPQSRPPPPRARTGQGSTSRSSGT